MAVVTAMDDERVENGKWSVVLSTHHNPSPNTIGGTKKAWSPFFSFTVNTAVMDIRQELLKEHSRKQAEYIARWIGHDPQRFAALMHLLMQDEYRVVQRAVWVVSMVAEKYPELPGLHLEVMISKLEEPGSSTT